MLAPLRTATMLVAVPFALVAASFRGPGPVAIALEVNGERRTIHAPPRRTLVDALREDCGLTGAKRACDRGDCGACTVLLDGVPAYACLLLAVQCEGRTIETVEGLARSGELRPIQEAFLRADAYQCGYCTPGQVISIAALLRRGGEITEEEVRRAVVGNLCRCGAYPKIVSAGVAAAKGKSADREGGSGSREVAPGAARKR